MFGTLGGPELFLIVVVALIVFGPRKLPDIGKSLGRMMAEFRKASTDFQRTIEDEVEAEKLREATRIEVPSWSPGDSSTSSSSSAALPPAAADQAGHTSTGEASAGTAGDAGAYLPASSEPPADAPPPSTVSRGDVPAENK